MDLATAMSVAQTLLAALQCSQQLKEMCFFFGYQSKLQNLQETVATVNAVLRDAEAKQVLSDEAQLYIEQLKDAVYDADDLIDESVTRAERKQKQLAEGGKVKKVRLCFSLIFKDLPVAHKVSRGVEEVRKRLEGIANNHNQFGLKLDTEPIRKRRKETCSYVYAQNIIGREDDMEKIVGMLLDSNVQRDASFLTIVGVGGLGKTTLAQLVYNDERVTKHFDLKLWVCVSDEDPKHLDVKAILGKILELSTGNKNDGLAMEQVQRKLREQLTGNKYLLVLDDVWNENHYEWLELGDFIRGCGRESWVVVTTRSRKTARIIGVGSEYELQGLSQEDSWHLFERIAFEQGEGQASPHDELVEIGQTIVKRCANIPLAIKVVASLLYGQGMDKWQSFLENGLAEIGKVEDISPILKLSYHNLEPPLKSCFSYCAIFPKDFNMKKEMLINLWMAQGYIVPNEGQSMEDVAEEYFSILLLRCFFQDVLKNIRGEIYSCKMHDLMHDIAQQVAGDEVVVVNSSTSGLNRKTRHVSYAQKGKYIKREELFSKKIGIRTCLLLYGDIELAVDVLLGNWRCLRTLDLHISGIKTLPYTIGNLLHLRYLDLSHNGDLEVLPKSITKLHNLQTLNLGQCYGLKELPNDLSKLAKLRVLGIWNLYWLPHMPPNMGELNCLYRLPIFVVSEVKSSSKQGVVDQVNDLKALTNLKGHLEIMMRIPSKVAYVKANNSDQEGHVRSKPHLKSIEYMWENEERDGKEEFDEALLEDLQQPCRNLRILELNGYGGKRNPASWMKEDNFSTTLFPSLVQIEFYECHGLQHLPSLGNLRHLRVLKVDNLRELEYMEEDRIISSSHSDAGPASLFFPSLEILELEFLPKLKGWWRDDDDDDDGSRSSVLPSFPCLSRLFIYKCPELTRIPLCPTVEDLSLRRINERLQVIEIEKSNRDQERGPSTSTSTTTACSSIISGNWKLKKITTDNLRGLNSVLPMPMEEAFQCLTHMTIEGDSEMESMEQVWEVIQICSSSLESLRISFCDNLRSLSMSKDDDDDGHMPWRCLHQSLRSLVLNDLPKVVKLPKGMQYLTSLQSLLIRDCEALESVPHWMPSLTSLTQLEIMRCSEGLKQRCKTPDGEDWPHIQHIPVLTIY